MPTWATSSTTTRPLPRACGICINSLAIKLKPPEGSTTKATTDEVPDQGEGEGQDDVEDQVQERLQEDPQLGDIEDDGSGTPRAGRGEAERLEAEILPRIDRNLGKARPWRAAATGCSCRNCSSGAIPSSSTGCGRSPTPMRSARFAERWYTDPSPNARRLLLAYLERPLNAFRHEALIKRLFKHAEAAGDDAVMARFLVAFDRSIRRVDPEEASLRSRARLTVGRKPQRLVAQWKSQGYDQAHHWDQEGRAGRYK